MAPAEPCNYRNAYNGSVNCSHSVTVNAIGPSSNRSSSPSPSKRSPSNNRSSSFASPPTPPASLPPPTASLPPPTPSPPPPISYAPSPLVGHAPVPVVQSGASSFEGFHNNYEGTDTTDKATIIGVVVGATMLLMFIVLIVYIIKRKRPSGNMMTFRKKDNKNVANIKAFLRSHDLHIPRQYSYREIKKMTNFFKEKLGQGGFGGVYKGKLPDGRLVAVKVLIDSKSNGEDFINEVSSISRTSHVNIVSLLGFCYKPKRVLVYEFMSNGSLDKLIYNQGPSGANNCQLEWKMLYEIAIGIARGLEYLHQGCNTRILHFDIKPHNILLDDNFCAKISDFGLAKLSKTGQSTVSMLGARGTRGYIAPEVCSNHFGRVSFKSDVYSFGMMVFEMVGKRKNIDPNVSQTSRIYFPHYIYKHVEASQDIHFDGVRNEEDEEIAKKMVLVSLWCIQTNPSDRPSMSGVIEMLQGRLQSLLLPPNPFLSSPPTSPQHSGKYSGH